MAGPAPRPGRSRTGRSRTGRSRSGSPPRTGRRRLTVVCLTLVLAAVGLWAASRLTWVTAAFDAVGRGRVPVTATGAELAPALTGVALLALAGVAAAVALAGVPRRALGLLLAAAGVFVGVTVGRFLLSPPSAADLAALPGAPAGGTPTGPAAVVTGVVPAAVAAALLVAAGAVLLLRERSLSRFGARYAARPAAPAPTDPDRAAWAALDAGHDPTVQPDPPADPARQRPRPDRTDGGAPEPPV